jgi:hypothetical protein
MKIGFEIRKQTMMWEIFIERRLLSHTHLGMGKTLKMIFIRSFTETIIPTNLLTFMVKKNFKQKKKKKFGKKKIKTDILNQT